MYQSIDVFHSVQVQYALFFMECPPMVVESSVRVNVYIVKQAIGSLIDAFYSIYVLFALIFIK